jgi:hypothetical protein
MLLVEVAVIFAVPAPVGALSIPHLAEQLRGSIAEPSASKWGAPDGMKRPPQPGRLQGRRTSGIAAPSRTPAGGGCPV